jgi:uncharacterized NAD(P)/FAD-binding protein YdhS
MHEDEPYRIAIVGMGFAGTATAVALLRGWGGAPLALHLIERRGRPGPGVAYSTPCGEHLLNVRAGAMSLLEDDPGDFARWLAARDPGAAANGFAPRRSYGAYLAESLDAAERGARAQGLTVRRHADEAVDVLPGGAWRCPRVLLRTGRELDADTVVLAPGPGRPAPPAGLREHAGLVADACDWPSLAHLGRARRVLVVGTGLTMVDAALSLVPEGCRGPEILAVSRHGLLPRAHRAAAEPGSFRPVWPRRPLTADGLARGVERAVRDACAAGEDWRPVVDGLRPETQRLWRALGLEERRRFLERHARRWDVLRHRMAPEVHARVRELRAHGRLRILPAGVLGLDPLPGGRVAARLRLADGSARVEADAVLGATGFGLGSDEPLIAALVAGGAAAPDPLGLGLRTAPDGALLDARGEASDAIYTLGAQRRGDLWESTAVPEIRAQAAAIAAAVTTRHRHCQLSRSSLIS